MSNFALLADTTPLVLTFNEAPNIARVLDGLTWARRVVIVDSYSNDETEAIATSYANVVFLKRRFDSHADQWNFGLQETSIDTEWVLALDADFILSDEVLREIDRLVPDAAVGGYRAPFTYCVAGRPLRAAVYPPVTVLYRRASAKYVQDGHTQRLQVTGVVRDLAKSIYHDDRKSLQHWLNSQSRYMRLEADKLRQLGFYDTTTPNRIRKLIVVAPLLVFCYCMFVKGNILDGRYGLFYALQRAVAEAVLSLYLLQTSILLKGSAKVACPSANQAGRN